MNSGRNSGKKSGDPSGQASGKSSGATVKVRQIGSPVRRHHGQRETLIGLKLNKIGRVADLVDSPQTRGMIAKVAHLVKVVED